MSLSFSLEPVVSPASIAELWQELERRQAASFFVSWRWIGTWLECLPHHVQPRLLRAFRDGETVAAAILVLRRVRRRGFVDVHQLHFNATGDPALDCLTIEHNGVVGTSDAALWQALLGWFAEGKAGADELVLSGGLEPFPVPTDEFGLLHTVRTQRGFIRNLAGPGHELPLSRNTRQQLRRSVRACEALGPVRIEEAATPDVALAWFDELKALHIRSWTRRGKRHAFHVPFFEMFHRRLLVAGAADGTVRLSRLSAGDTILGYLYAFCRDGRVYAYQSGFDSAREALRPGYVAHALAIERCAHAGLASYDFLAGENQLKQSLSNEAYFLGWRRWGLPTLGLKAEAVLVSAARALLRR